MRTEFVYSFMALGTIPVMVNAADVQTISSDVLASTDGSKVTYPVGKLVPGSYKFTAKLTSKVYGVTINIGGQELKFADGNANAQDVSIEFALTAETDVELSLVSTDPGESGAGFTVAGAVVSLENVNFSSIKATLAGNAETLAGIISSYNYSATAKEEDVNAANALKTKANGVAESYDDYKKYKLYAEKSTIQEEIDALAESAAGKEAAYQNEQAYNRVNAAITAIKNQYNTAVAELEEVLVDAAAYLLDGAKAKLNTDINQKITAATSASYASYTGKTAVADEATNMGLVPTEDDLNNIVEDYKNQATSNKEAYVALTSRVNTLQNSLDAVKVVDESLTATFAEEKAAAQTAITNIKTTVEGVYNKAGQLTLDIDAAEAAAQGKINTLSDKVTTANAEFNANKATTEAIAAVQKKLDDAKTAVNGMVSADGNYKAADYYAAYVATVQGKIDALTTTAAAAYKVDGTGTAQAYNAALNTTGIEDEITAYQTNAAGAVAKYDALQTAMASYTKDLADARAKVEGLAVYTAEGYDYVTSFDLIQKRINDINKAITAAKGKVGEEHWNAMLGIDADAAITTDIANLLSQVQADQNQYDADALATGITTLTDKIAAFNTKAADDSKLGDDYAKFAAVEAGIESAFNDVLAEKNSINASSETVDYTANVGTAESVWAVGTIGHTGATPRTPAAGLINGVQMIDQWNSSSNNNTGTALVQKLTNLPNGSYVIELYASAVDQASGNPNNGKTDIAFVYANGVETPVTITTAAALNTYTLENVKVTDGTLEMGLTKKKSGSNWHLIQIKSLKATTASFIQRWGAEIAELNAQQADLETLAAEIEAKVTANSAAKTANAGNIDGLQAKIATFKTTYKIGEDDSTLGNRGKADGSITKEVDEIEAALGTLESNNNAIDVTAVTKVDDTANVGTTADDWKLADFTHGGGNRNKELKGLTLAEQWRSSGDATYNQAGKVLYQQLTDLPNGIYDIVLYALAVDQASNYPNKGKTDVAYVYANDVQKQVTVQGDAEANIVAQEYTLNNVVVSDGTLEMGLAKAKGGTNWHAIQIKSLTYHENTNANLAKYNEDYVALAERKNVLDAAAPGIKTAVENNAAAKTAADAALTALGTYELDNLKSLADVSKADATYNGRKGNVVRTEDASGWEDFYVYQSGLDADKSYSAKKQAIDDNIAALTTAISDAFAAETLPYPWADEITVVVEDDPATADVDESSSTTYKISDIKAAVDAVKAEAAAESTNYWAYRNIYSGKNSVTPAYSSALTAAKTDLETVTGAGALDYYNGVIEGYETEFANLEKAMRASLYARTCSDDATAHKDNIKALTNNLKTVQTNAKANLDKYTEQKTAYTETQNLWNSTYTEIAATDHSSKVQDYLDELDAIQVTLTAATNAVEDNYKNGKSVAEAQDFAAIKAAINDVKARQAESYSEFVTADNKAAHESFMGNDETKGTIQLATEAYQKAVQERAQYSSSNADLEAAITAAAGALDEALFNCPTEILDLTEAENKAYTETVSPTIFNVSQFNADATAIEQNITAELGAFKAAVKTAIGDFWTPNKTDYEAKVAAAENDIAAYSDDAKQDAFKDVKNLIADGDAAVAAINLSGVEDAIAGLEGIDDMLDADKDAAANKDLTPQIAAADKKYGDVKTYITGVTNEIPAKAEQLANLETEYLSVSGSEEAGIVGAKQLDKTFANHDNIKDVLDTFVAAADGCKTAVENAVTADNANTAAYNEVAAAIAPVEAKLAEAKEKAAQYKYETSFVVDDEMLIEAKDWAKDAKNNGYAVNDKAALLDYVTIIDGEIDATLTLAYGTEKAGLASDITELKNQFNAYVAANGLDETAIAFKKDIEELEKAVNEAAIVDLDNPADDIQYDEILAATDALIKLQGDIADKGTELLAANASGANAEVLADFTAQLDALDATASLDEYDEWVGQQTLNGKTLDEQITALKAQIADTRAAIEAEANISFYKDNYQKQLDAIKEALDPVAEAITAKDAQFKANAAAYERLTAEINELQGKIDAAKEKVGAYEYAAETYITYIEQYYIRTGELRGGAQYLLNIAKADIEADNANKALTENSVVARKANIELWVQNYLDYSANAELDQQRSNLSTLLTYAIDVKYETNKYSNALWNRLVNEKSGINDEINALERAINYSYDTNEWDENGNKIEMYDEDNNFIGYQSKARTSDADFAGQMETVAAIKAEIETLATAVDNLALLGDANEDGKVNVLDYQKVANMILDPTIQPEEGTDLFTNIDINQSEVIEVGDLTAIVNYILNGDWQGYAAARARLGAESESLTMNVLSAENGRQRIAVNLQNANDYTAFQLDVVLPNGMKLVGAELTDRAGDSHKLMSRAQLDGSIRMLASSVKGESFKGSEGAVLYIDVEGADAANVELLNILFSDLQAGTRAFSLTGENATAISSVSTFESLKQKVYDLSGRVMNGLKKGVNIIRRADGSTQKVVK